MSPKTDFYPLLSHLLAIPENPPSCDSLTPQDWQTIGQLASSHGVAPLLHYHANQHPWGESLPGELCQALAREYYASAAQNALLIAELERILGVLNNAGIPVVVLKGAHLAQAIYPDPALRPMHDLDLLVHPEHLFPAIKALKTIGYRQQKITYHAVLAGGPDRCVNLELHWLLLPSRDPKAMMAWFWERTEPFGGDELSPRESFCFNPTATLLYLAGHLGMMHAGEQPPLLWWYDLVLLGRDREVDVDWGQLIRNGEPWGLMIGVLKLKVIYQDVIKDSWAWYLINNPYLSNIILSSTKTDFNWNWKIFTNQAFQLLYISDRMKAILGLVFPNKDYIQQNYKPKPNWVWPIYYIERFREIISKEIIVAG